MAKVSTVTTPKVPKPAASTRAAAQK
ncbi:MAG: hypothetical protein QOC79_964, partial [Actinomycetota bacterium]|nr:hypothetical protein [Actinomycetota bacterium]